MSLFDLFDALEKASQGNQLNYLIIAGLVVVTMWVYREVRKSILENERLNRQDLDRAIVAYSELELMLINNPRCNAIEISPKIVAAYPYFSYKMVKTVRTLLEGKEDFAVSNLKDAVQREINRLKSLQSNPIVNVSNGWVIDDIVYFLKLTRFSSFIQPILFLLVTFFMIIILFTLWYGYNTLNVMGRVKLTINLFSLVTNGLLLLGLGQALTENKFKHTRLNWVKLLFMTVLPASLWIILNNAWFGTIDAIFVWVYVIVFFKDTRKDSGTDE